MLMGGIDKTTKLAELDARSRIRPLTAREAHCLALALKRDEPRKGQKPWTRDELSRLKRLLKRGRKPAQIAPILGRTERAIWRTIYKHGLSVGDLCPAGTFTPSRKRSRVQSPAAEKRATPFDEGD